MTDVETLEFIAHEIVEAELLLELHVGVETAEFCAFCEAVVSTATEELIRSGEESDPVAAAWSATLAGHAKLLRQRTDPWNWCGGIYVHAPLALSAAVKHRRLVGAVRRDRAMRALGAS